MNKKYSVNGFLILMLIAAACATESGSQDSSSEESYFVTGNAASDFKKMQWLAGSWKGMYNGKPFYEAWRAVNDSTMANYNIEIKDADTLVKESGTIHVRGENVFYGTDSVYWKLSTMTSEELVFKNDTLPYSRTILWKHTPEDHWYTKLSHPNGSASEYDLVKQPELDLYVAKSINK